MARHSYLGIVFTFVLTIGLVALGAFAYGRRDQLIARYLASQSSEVSDRGLERHFRRLAALGPEGIPALVEALASGRPAARQAAVVVLDEVVAQQIARHAESPAIERLANGLAGARDILTEPAHAAALRWSSRIVAEQYRDGRRNPAVLAACRRIQETRTSEPESVPTLADTRSPDSGVFAQGESVLATGGEIEQEAPAAQSNDVGNGDPDGAAHDPGDDSPLTGQPARLPGHVETTSATMPQPDEIALDSPAPGDLGAKTTEELAEATAVSPLPDNEAAGEEASASLQPDAPDSPAGGLSRSASVPAGVQAELERRPGGLSDRDLLTLLHHDDQEVSGWAENELRRREIGREEIALGRLITHPDPGIRARLARRLPRTPNVDRVVWLLELSHDAHAGVRLAALASFAEIRDELLEARVRTMIEDDPESAVRERAGQIARILEGSTAAPPLLEDRPSTNESPTNDAAATPASGTNDRDGRASRIPDEAAEAKHGGAPAVPASGASHAQQPATPTDETPTEDERPIHLRDEDEKVGQKRESGAWHARFAPVIPEPLEPVPDAARPRAQPPAVEGPTDDFLPAPPPGRSVTVPTNWLTTGGVTASDRSAEAAEKNVSSETFAPPDVNRDPAPTSPTVRHWRPARPKKGP